MSPPTASATSSLMAFSLVRSVNSSKGVAEDSPSSPILTRAEDPLAGVPTPISEMAHCWTPLFGSVSAQATTPSTVQSDASKACRCITDGNDRSVVKDLLTTFDDDSPQPRHHQADGPSGAPAGSPVKGLCQPAPKIEVTSSKVSSVHACLGAK